MSLYADRHQYGMRVTRNHTESLMRLDSKLELARKRKVRKLKQLAGR